MSRVFELDLTLAGTAPRLWRRLRVPANLTLGELHRAIQAVMDWGDLHLHLFEVGDDEYGPPSEVDDEDEEDLPGDERRITVADALKHGAGRITYIYDFRAEWRVEIAAAGEAISSPSVRIECLAGERANPPERSGSLAATADGPRSPVAGVDAGDAGAPGMSDTGFDVGAANERLRDEFADAQRVAGAPPRSPDERLFADLTLLLLFLGSWREGSGTRAASKNLRMEVLDALAEAGLVTTNPHRKTVILTADGVARAQQLRDAIQRGVAGL